MFIILTASCPMSFPEHAMHTVVPGKETFYISSCCLYHPVCQTEFLHPGTHYTGARFFLKNFERCVYEIGVPFIIIIECDDIFPLSTFDTIIPGSSEALVGCPV